MTWSFSLLRKNSINFFLQFSSIYLSILKLLQFSLNFFYLLQFFPFFSLPTLVWRLILSRRTWWMVLIHISQRHPWYHRRGFRDTMCEPYKSLKTILGLAKPTSNHFLQFSLNFFNLLQFASCSFFLSPIFSFFLRSLHYRPFGLWILGPIQPAPKIYSNFCILWTPYSIAKYLIAFISLQIAISQPIPRTTMRSCRFVFLG